MRNYMNALSQRFQPSQPPQIPQMQSSPMASGGRGQFGNPAMRRGIDANPMNRAPEMMQSPVTMGNPGGVNIYDQRNDAATQWYGQMRGQTMGPGEQQAFGQDYRNNRLGFAKTGQLPSFGQYQQNLGNARNWYGQQQQAGVNPQQLNSFYNQNIGNYLRTGQLNNQPNW